MWLALGRRLGLVSTDFLKECYEEQLFPRKSLGMGPKKEVAWVNVCGGPLWGKWWKKGELGQSWEPLDGKLLKGIIL